MAFSSSLEDGRILVQLYIDVCMSQCGALTAGSTYHATFPPRVLLDNPPICHIEALSASVAIKLWAFQIAHQLNTCFATMRQQSPYFKLAEAKTHSSKHAQTCAQWDITLTVGHIPGQLLQDTADALSRYHLGQIFWARVSSLLKDKGMSLQLVPDHLFTLSDSIQFHFRISLASDTVSTPSI